VLAVAALPTVEVQSSVAVVLEMASRQVARQAEAPFMVVGLERAVVGNLLPM
jgi:hypothetical protein